jgi:hypothetical protein
MPYRGLSNYLDSFLIICIKNRFLSKKKKIYEPCPATVIAEIEKNMSNI